MATASRRSCLTSGPDVRVVLPRASCPCAESASRRALHLASDCEARHCQLVLVLFSAPNLLGA